MRCGVEKVNDIDGIKAGLLLKIPSFTKRVAPLYKMLDWHWSSCNGVPDEVAIAATLTRLVNLLHAGATIRSGGLEVWSDEEGAGLAFVVVANL